METFDVKAKSLLKDKLEKIESILQTDVISFYGYIEDHLSDYFIRLIKELKSAPESNRKVLTVILHSDGGESTALEKVYKAIFEHYDSFNVVVPNQVISTGTAFVFMADNILINRNTSSFSMIDPQVLTSFNTYCSVFFEFEAFGYKYKLIDADNIDISLELVEPEVSKRNEIYHIRYLNTKEAMISFRKLCFDMLINHHFKNYSEKESKAIRLINYLMEVRSTLRIHESKIYPHYLEEYGMKFNYYTDSVDLDIAITDYDNTIRLIIGKSDDYFYNTSGYGNYINCVLQSKNRAII